MHAPLSDPGGVLRTRLFAPRTAAFRPLETVGFPLSTSLRVILLSTTLPISGRNDAACILVPSSSVRPLLGVHVDVTSDLLARLWSGGTCTVSGSHPLGNNNPFHGTSPNSKVSGLPWRDQCLVRRWVCQGTLAGQHPQKRFGSCPPTNSLLKDGSSYGADARLQESHNGLDDVLERRCF